MLLEKYKNSKSDEKKKVKSTPKKPREDHGMGNYHYALRDFQQTDIHDELNPPKDPVLRSGNWVANEKALDDWMAQLYGY